MIASPQSSKHVSICKLIKQSKIGKDVGSSELIQLTHGICELMQQTHQTNGGQQPTQETNGGQANVVSWNEGSSMDAGSVVGSFFICGN